MEVYLAGEFNDWKPKAIRMDGPDENGLFTIQLELAEGVYQYKYVIEGEEEVGSESLTHYLHLDEAPKSSEKRSDESRPTEKTPAKRGI